MASLYARLRGMSFSCYLLLALLMLHSVLIAFFAMKTYY